MGVGAHNIMDGENDINDPTRGRGFHIAHLNAQSVRNKLTELSVYIKKMNFDVFTISETWLNDCFPEDLLHIDGFNMVRLDRSWGDEGSRQVKRGGGVAIYTKQDLHVSIHEHAEHNISTSDLELLWVRINMPNSRNINIGTVYRPPSGKVDKCCDILIDSVNDINSIDKADMFLLGDFNINYLDKKSESYKNLHRFELLSNLKQHIRQPTRKGHCLDLIYSNCEIISNSGVLDVMLSDHDMIFATRKKDKTTYNHVTFRGRSYRNYVKEDLRHHLTNTDWDNYYTLNNPNDCWSFIVDIIVNKINEMCPLKSKSVRDKNEPWLTNEILEAMFDKDRAWKRAKSTKLEADINLAKQLRNETKNIVRRAKANFVQDYLEDGHTSSKKFWEKIQYVTNSRNKCPTINLVDKVTEQPVETNRIPEYINTFFTNIGPDLAKRFDQDWVDDIPDIEHCILNEIILSEKEIIETVKEIDVHKSSAVDDLSARVLKDSFEYIPKQLTHMFNCSLRTGIFPDSWKRATVVPLQKGGDKSNVSNLRPVSLLPLPGKLLEKLAHNRVSKFLNENRLLNNGQNGFRKGRSTMGTVAELTDDVLLGINNNKCTLAAFVDLKKAFDTVSHEILGKKLHKFGLNLKLINWLKNYLVNRQQRCKANGITSDYLDIRCGVPQGSIIGPMLFLLYINDINNTLSKCDSKLYADDTVVYATHSQEGICHEWLCEDLGKLIHWFFMNRLTINLDKTKLMMFATKNRLKKMEFRDVNVQGKTLQYVRQFNYLGVKLDSRLSFEAHANECIRLVSHKIYMLTKIRCYLDKQQALTIYKSKVLPYFDYGDIFLMGTHVKTRDMLQKLQNRALRLVLNKDSRHNVWQLHHAAKVPYLDDRRICHLANFVYHRKYCDNYVSLPIRPLRQYEAPVLIEYQANNTTFERSVLYRGAKYWNGLTVETRNIENYEAFKKNRKNVMLSLVL